MFRMRSIHGMRFWAHLVSFFWVAFHLVAAAQTGSGGAIVIGQSAAMSGPASELGREMRLGAQAFFDSVNAQGGVNGKRIELKTLDDGYEPDRAAANTRALVNEDVFALFGYVGTPTSAAALPILTAAKVPFVGAFTGAELLRDPFNRYVFNVRASYFQETEKLVELLTLLGSKKIAVFYQNDSYGQAGLKGVQQALERRSLKPHALATVERNSVDVSAAVKAIGDADPQAVVMISAYKSCAAFIKAMRKVGKNPQFMNVSFVGSKALSKELGPDGKGVGISQVVPFPWYVGTPVVKEYQGRLKATDPNAEYSFTSLEGYLAAKVLVEGLRRAGSNPTRERFVNAMESINGLDLGGFNVNFSAKDHNASKFTEVTMIRSDGGFAR